MVFWSPLDLGLNWVGFWPTLERPFFKRWFFREIKFHENYIKAAYHFMFRYSVKDVMSPKYLKSNNNSLHGWFVETKNRADCCFFHFVVERGLGPQWGSFSGTDNILQFTSKSREQFAVVLDLYFLALNIAGCVGWDHWEHFLEGITPLRLSLNGIVVPSVTKKSRQTAEC